MEDFRTKVFFNLFLPIGTFILIYATLNSYFNAKTKLDDLSIIKDCVYDYAYYGDKSEVPSSLSMILYLTKSSNISLTNEWEDKFLLIEDALKKSNIIEFHQKERKKWKIGTNDIIYQIKIGTDLIFNAEERRDKCLNNVEFTGYMSLCGIIGLLLRRYYTLDPENKHKKKIEDWIKRNY